MNTGSENAPCPYPPKWIPVLEIEKNFKRRWAKAHARVRDNINVMLSSLNNEGPEVPSNNVAAVSIRTVPASN
jgi:hypothetical protein